MWKGGRRVLEAGPPAASLHAIILHTSESRVWAWPCVKVSRRAILHTSESSVCGWAASISMAPPDGSAVPARHGGALPGPPSRRAAYGRGGEAIAAVRVAAVRVAAFRVAAFRVAAVRVAAFRVAAVRVAAFRVAACRVAAFRPEHHSGCRGGRVRGANCWPRNPLPSRGIPSRVKGVEPLKGRLTAPAV